LRSRFAKHYSCFPPERLDFFLDFLSVPTTSLLNYLGLSTANDLFRHNKKELRYHIITSSKATQHHTFVTKSISIEAQS